LNQPTVNHDRAVDLVWARSLEKIMKGEGPAAVRSQLGDEIDSFIPQVATGVLLSANPAFARILYTSAYVAAKRNSFFAMRRLGMPSDFFWKFDMWSDEKAQSTISKVVERLFKQLLHAGRQGLLEFLKVDVPATRFEIAFSDCAECHGMIAERTACNFHAGTFAGIFGAMLDRDLDCVETACIAAGAERCTFSIGLPNNRDIAVMFDKNMTDINVTPIPIGRLDTSSNIERRTIDIGYYQQLLSSAISGNLSTLERTCFDTGTMVGNQLGEVLKSRFGGITNESVSAIYRELRYLDLTIDLSSKPDITISTSGAPEATGALADTAFVPFLAGELQSLLNMAGHKVNFSRIEKHSETQNVDLIFVPEV